MSWFKSKWTRVDLPSVDVQLMEVRRAMIDLQVLAGALKDLTASLDALEDRNGRV